MGQHGRATTRPNLGRAREIARSVLAETLSGSDEYITLWPTDEDDTPHVPTTVKTIRGNYKADSVGAAALSSVDGDEAVDSAHVRTGAATKRWFGAAENPDIPAGVRVPTGQLRGNVNIGGVNNQADIADKAIIAGKIAHNPHGNDPLGNQNLNDNDKRAIGDEHVKAKGLKGYNFDDRSVGNRVLASGIDGGKLAKKSVPSKAIHDVHGSKITGNESIPWKRIKVKGVVFTPRLNRLERDLKKYMDNNFQRKPNN